MSGGGPGPDCPQCGAPGREAARRFSLAHDDGQRARAFIHLWMECEACGQAWEREVRRDWCGRTSAPHPGVRRAKAERVVRRLYRAIFDLPPGALAGRPRAWAERAARFSERVRAHSLGAPGEVLRLKYLGRAERRLCQHGDGRVNFKYNPSRRRAARFEGKIEG